MSLTEQIETLSRRLTQAWQDRAVALKAVSFALIGVVNTSVDAAVFFLGHGLLARSPAATGVLGDLAAACGCASTATTMLVAANVFSWTVAVSGSYVMNSYITFAVESGRKLTPRAYAGFLASGLVGLVANTTTLVAAAQVLPVWAAKGCAIFASFVVNFAMSHFVVFRHRPENADL